MRGTLYVVATPIGNLKDISLRALEVLRGVDAVLAEDTRVTRKLLAHYRIRKPLMRCDARAEPSAAARAAAALCAGSSLALFVDAGTPAISDPGARLIAYIRAHAPEARIAVIPGPSALTAALSLAGVSADRFTFVGYPPHRKGRQKFFRELAAINVRPLVLFESPHRLQKTFSELAAVLGTAHRIVVCSELTKVHEEVFAGTLADAEAHFTGTAGKGEFVLVVP